MPSRTARRPAPRAAAEQDDDCGGIYHKSLLYLVSHSFEKEAQIPGLGRGFAGEPILGMGWWMKEDKDFARLVQAGRVDCVKGPNSDAPATGNASTAAHHGAFDDHGPTLQSTLARILGPAAATAKPAEFDFTSSDQKLAERRAEVMR